MATVADLTAADLDLIVEPATQSITFTITQNGSAFNASGTWLMKVRGSVRSTAADLTPTVDTTNAATGIVVVNLTEAGLLALIPPDAAGYHGVYTLERNTVPWFEGRFVVQQKASRA